MVYLYPRMFQWLDTIMHLTAHFGAGFDDNSSTTLGTWSDFLSVAHRKGYGAWTKIPRNVVLPTKLIERKSVRNIENDI